jgi:micrococcal nuclease
VGIAGTLMICITLFCIASAFPKQTNVTTQQTAVFETAVMLQLGTLQGQQLSTLISPPTFPPTWTNTPVPTETPVLIPTPNLTPLGSSLSVPGGSCIPNHDIEVATVSQVVDGDTIHVMMNGKEYKVRYIGMDAPEMTGETYSEQAKEYNSKLVSGQTVMMVKDQSETDKYDRLLRYVIAGNTFVNYDLVEKGFARAKDYPPDSACKSVFVDAMATAKASNLGLWAAAAAAVVPTTAPTSVVVQSNCDPSYPDFCIPPPPPDLDCKDVLPHKRFRVLQPDPHHFDRDLDGIGCEGG